MIRMFFGESAKVVHHRNNPTIGGTTVLLSSQAATDHLHVSHGAKYLTRDEHHVCLGRVEASRENAMVAQYPDLATLEAIEKVAPRHGRSVPANGSRGNACEIQACRHLFRVLHRVCEKKDGTLLALLNLLHEYSVALRVPRKALIDRFQQVLEVQSFPKVWKTR